MAAVLAVISAISKVLDVINGVYNFVKNASEFFSGASDWDQVRSIISSQIQNRNQILQVAGDILDAVAQLDRRIFLETIADKLGDSDQAVLALDTWKRTGNLNQSAMALNESAGALSDVLRYSSTGVYPNESLVFPCIEILVMRLLILKEADPDFVLSPIGRQPIQAGVQLIRSAADSLESAVYQANEIHSSNQIIMRVTVLPESEGGGRETVRVLRLSVTYRNLDGTVTFEEEGEFEPGDGDFDDIIQQANAGAAAARQRGLAHDLERAQIKGLREAADTAERCLLVSEARWVSTNFYDREPTEIETAYYLARRQRAGFDEVALAMVENMSTVEDMSIDKSSLGALVERVSGRSIDRKAEESLWNVAHAFGTKGVLRLVLSDAKAAGQMTPQLTDVTVGRPTYAPTHCGPSQPTPGCHPNPWSCGSDILVRVFDATGALASYEECGDGPNTIVRADRSFVGIDAAARAELRFPALPQ